MNNLTDGNFKPSVTSNGARTPPFIAANHTFNDSYHQVVNELAAIVGHSIDRGLAARAAWSLALCVSAYRATPAFAPLVPELVYNGAFTVAKMLEQADDAAVAELVALRELCNKRLIPQLAGPYHLGPTFDLSDPGPGQRIAAEADLIAGGLLIDIKTTLGPKNKAGLRPEALKAENIYQLLGYALLDYSNRYKIDQIGIFSARYGTLVTWPLERVTSLMSGMTFDIPAARQDVWEMMKQDAA